MATSTPEQRPIVEAKQLCKRYGNDLVVDHLDLRIPAGSCFGLLGPNGAGKTTTLRMLLGLTPPSSGELQVLGHAVHGSASNAASSVRERVGLVPQMDNLDPDFTVEENLRVYASFFVDGQQGLESRLDELLDFVELQEKRNAKINTLSGGMKRRLAIARALVNDPDLLVLDEPTTGLDPQVRHLIWSRLRELQKRGKTLLLTTHYMDEAERLCDQVVVIDHGHIIAQGSPAELIRDHVEPHVFEFPGASDSWLSNLDKFDDLRTERSGSTVYAYTNDAEPLQALIDSQADAAKQIWLRRPANLEDSFLRLTQRELRE